jgi:peroxiredoxin
VTPSTKGGKVFQIPDGCTEFTRKTDMLVGNRNMGLMMRSWRYSMLVEDGGIIKTFAKVGYGDNLMDYPFEASDTGAMIG